MSLDEGGLRLVRDTIPVVNRKPYVILLAGPGGAGKTTTAARIAQHPDWEHLSEDDYWVKIKEGHPWGELRTREEQLLVQDEVVRRLIDLATRKKNVVLEFILYEDPPHPLLNYQNALRSKGVPFTSRVLRPSVDEVLRRMTIRGRPRDADMEKSRAQVEHQIQCLASQHIRGDWAIDTSGVPLEEVYLRYFRAIVENVE